MNDRAIVGEGTAEEVWLDWLARQNIPRMTAQALCAGRSRLVVVAPHPDDEILACGGLLAQCAAVHFPVVVVAVTDGEASHGKMDELARTRLGQQREHEQCAGLVQLGIDPACVVRLQIPDGDVALDTRLLVNRLRSLLQPGDVVVTTWCLDGHPDHEATAHALLGTGCKLFQAPVWMWHWAQPGDVRIPWADLLAIDLPDSTIRAKQSALTRHLSQLCERSTESGPVLVPAIVARAARQQEYFFAWNGHP